MKFIEKLNLVSNNLTNTCLNDREGTKGGHNAEALAHTLIDINESCETIVNKLFPRLLTIDLRDDDVENLLIDIGEELRHILYHVNDSEYYNYLKDKE